MADTKITGLTELNAAPATDDLLVIVDTSDTTMAASGTDKKITVANLVSGGGLFDAYALYQDQKTAGTAGGSSSTGSFLTRTLNAEVFDPAGIGSLSSNAVTVGAGSYYVRATAPFGSTGNVGQIIQIRIRDTTNNSTIATSSAQRPGSAATVVDNSTMVVAEGRLVAAGSVAIEVQYRTDVAVTTNGLGWPANYGETETYTSLLICREA